MVVVALLAARATTAPTPTMMSTLSPTSSAAKAGSWSIRPSAQRVSMTTSRPST
jgi:hypothetical protein